MERHDRKVLGYWVLATVVLPLANPALFVFIATAGLPWVASLVLVIGGTCLLLGYVAPKVWSERVRWRTALGVVESIALSVLVFVIAVYIALDNCDGCLS